MTDPSGRTLHVVARNIYGEHRDARYACERGCVPPQR